MDFNALFHKVLLISLTVLSFQVAAQQIPVDKSRYIEVQGKAEVVVKPDVAQANLTIKVGPTEFQEVISALEQKKNFVVARLKGIGYQESEIITTNYSINEQYSWADGKRVNEGFVGVQSVYVRFPNDPARIGKLNTVFMNSDRDVQINYSFRLGDELKEKVRSEVLRKAVSNAKERAELLADASGIKLGKVQTVNYGGFEQRAYPSNRMMRSEMVEDAMAAESSAGFIIQDMIVHDEVLIRFGIVN